MLIKLAILGAISSFGFRAASGSGVALAMPLRGQVPVDEPPRLRTMLPNGALVLVDRVPHAKVLVVDLFVSSRGTEETPTTHGRRHLLEHLVALGRDGTLDRRLETAGAFLRAETLRDSTVFEMSMPPGGLKLAVEAIKELASEPTVSDADIAREAKLIDEEGALREPEGRASEAAWAKAFGDRGLDPFGDPDVIKATTPEQVKALHRRSFSANHLAVVVSGDVDLDAATKSVAEVLAFLPTVKREPVTPLPSATGPVAAATEGQFGAVPVPGYRSPQTAATLAAALALATGLSHGAVVYTPSAHPGLVILGNEGGTLGDEIAKANAASLFELGRLMAIRWVRTRMAEPTAAAAFRGMLLVQERDLKPETMLENLDALSYAEFRQAVEAFKSAGAGR